MAAPSPTVVRQAGATFLRDAAPLGHVFTPERFTSEHRMIAKTSEEFLLREVVPQQEAMEHDPQLNVPLMKRAGELGLLAIDVDEAYGGLGLDKVTSALVAETMGLCASFSVTHAGHVCIGTLPLLYFGTDEQKQRYLPKLASGEIIAAYALTEPGAGSDALAGRTTATLSADGREWILNGSKMWISNAGFADLFTVFAKIDGEHFSAFLVERTAPGLSFGHEERKMGIKGSSTRAVNLDQVRIPVGNLLGAKGQGGKIALNVLNVGRYKLGAGGVGGAKVALAAAVAYARERRQFGKAIAEFGAVRQKIARMATRTWAGAAAVYRTVGNIDLALDGLTASDAILKALEEYAIESSILKVVGSELVGFVADEAVQIFGGNGYSAEYPVDRYYRDARINRIFEGTNEINRLQVPTMLLKRSAKADLGIDGGTDALRRASAPAMDLPSWTEGVKRAGRGAFDLARAHHGAALAGQQDVLMALADIAIDTYVAESAVARAAQAAADGADAAAAHDLATAALADAAAAVAARARVLVDALAATDQDASALSDAVHAACRGPRINRLAIDERIAARTLV